MALLHGMLLVQLCLLAVVAPQPQQKPGCPDRCGDVQIPYPFGIVEGCSFSSRFNLTCNSSTTPPITHWPGSPTSILTDFLVAEAQLQMSSFIAKDCYDNQGNRDWKTSKLWVSPPYTISGTKNKFMAIGCDTYSLIEGYRDVKRFGTGCVTICDDRGSISNSCSGVGCCQTAIPSGLKNISISLASYDNHSSILGFNPCSYAFVVKDGNFTFSAKSSFEDLDKISMLPTVLDWVIGYGKCEDAKKRVDYECLSEHSDCVNRTINEETGESGYYCNCSPGYEGNPYLDRGCQDINECLANPCGNGMCENSNGTYSCKCNKGFKNEDQWKCVPANNTADNTPLKISLGVCISFFVLLVAGFVLYREYKKRQFNNMKKKYFDANGGPILEIKLRQLATQKDSSLSVQIYSAEVLKSATKNYNESEKIGEGGYGIVYRGVLGSKVVAVKISKATVQKSDQFINEVLVLSEINHRNVVKLLGCCLETKTPILVYEYISNGTLYDHIHKKKGEGEPLSFAQRLKIASETAAALSYLHHSITRQIIHRDVKATNILLDKDFTAKVSDFGASKLVVDDETQLQTLVQGTMGYLDPEYLQSNTLTDKSDVYSFGVVLVELLTGENAVRADKPEKERNLANVFVQTMETKAPLDPLLDPEIVKDEYREIIERVAKLAEKCLNVKGDERPRMTDIQKELDEMLNTLKTGENKINASSSKGSIVEVSDKVDGGSTRTNTRAEYDASMQNQAQKPSGVGR